MVVVDINFNTPREFIYTNEFDRKIIQFEYLDMNMFETYIYFLNIIWHDEDNSLMSVTLTETLCQ